MRWKPMLLVTTSCLVCWERLQDQISWDRMGQVY